MATTITVTGATGTAGADGADGDPGADGGPAGDGADVLAEAVTAGENNTATATGGAGGPGGAGGDGVPAGADGGNGGNGGAGGDATARAIGSGAESVSATAMGGDSGFEGNRGSATAPGIRGEFGVAGIGGDALAEATLDSDLPSLATATATAGRQYASYPDHKPGRGAVARSTVVNARGAATSTASAFAGRSGSGAPAEAIALATGSGDGAVTATATAQASGDENGATATARGTTDGTGAVTVSARADGGGGLTPTNTATAYGSNAGTAPVFVKAAATTDGYESLTSGGHLIANAEGYSSGGGDVTVEAYVFRLPLDLDFAAPGISLHDAVRGSTTGHLSLRQYVNFSPGPGAALYGRNGELNTSLHAFNPGGGALSALIIAGGGAAADLVLGDILARSVTGAPVDILVRASAGPYGGRLVQENRSDGTPSTPSRIYAESNGGSVRTTVEFSVHDGYRYYTGVPEPSPLDRPDGTSIEMIDVALGDTTGALSLEQTADAGSGFSPSFFLNLPPGSGGSAFSALSKSTASSELEISSQALAGAAGAGSEASDLATGGDAVAQGTGANSAGAARVFALAEGGRGNGVGGGGDAIAEASASTTGDGHDVVVGIEKTFTSQFFVPSGASGGHGSVTTCLSCPQGTAAGGNASSTSTGSASGDSMVTVFDNALGGRGGVRSFRPGTSTTEGAGGDATSMATATGGGISAVRANADARGGTGGGRASEPGGDADATASATGLGLVEAWARAGGGNSELTGIAGSALAHATANGASGFAGAEATTGAGALPQLRAQSEALVGSQRDVAAAAMSNAALASAPSESGLEASAFFTSAPIQEDVDTALAGNHGYHGFEGVNMVALARWVGDAGDDPLVLSTELELVMNRSDANHHLFLGAFGLSVLGGGFESLSLSLTRNGLSQLDLVFDTADEVIAFFTDSVLDLGYGWNAGDKFLAHFDLVLGRSTRFTMNLGYATAVPEPGSGLLLVFGLILFAIYRVTSNPAATRSHVAGPTPRSRSANFCTRPVGVCGSSPVISR